MHTVSGRPSDDQGDLPRFACFAQSGSWQVLCSDRYDAAVGSPPYGITLSEWALSNPAAWAYLAPIVIENGGWALFITTARGRSHAKSMLAMAQTRDDRFSEVLPVLALLKREMARRLHSKSTLPCRMG
jgi:phage terminase large subunit